MTPETVPHESPLVTIWDSPRATIRRIVDTNPRRGVNLLFFAAGAVSGLHAVAGQLDDFRLPWVAATAASVLFGFLYVPVGHLNALYRRWFASLLGGSATRIEIAASSAWSAVPIVLGHGAIWLVEFGLYGAEVLAAERPTMDAASPLLRTTLQLGTALFTLWSMTISVVGFAEVNRFSVLRAVATSVLASGLVAAIAGLAIAALFLL